MALPKFQKIRVTKWYSKKTRRRATNRGRKPRISLENRGKVLALSEKGTRREKLHIELVALKEVSATF